MDEFLIERQYFCNEEEDDEESCCCEFYDEAFEDEED